MGRERGQGGGVGKQVMDEGGKVLSTVGCLAVVQSDGAGFTLRRDVLRRGIGLDPVDHIARQAGELGTVHCPRVQPQFHPVRA